MRISPEPNPHKPAAAPNPDQKPWYRYGWVWFLIGIPGTSVIAGAVMLWIAISTADSLVADDYYKEGRGINQRLEKDQLAVDMGIKLNTSVTPSATPSGSGMQTVSVRFAAKPGVTPPELIRLRLSHPTLNQKDIIATLERSHSAQGLYETRLPGIASGRWYVQMEDEHATWRVRATWTVE